MELLTLALIMACCLMAGAMVAVVWVYYQMRSQHLAALADLAKVKADFTDSIAEAAKVNNTWADRLVSMQDQLMAHDMILKGAKR